MSKQIAIEALNLAVVPSRREGRINLRARRQRGSRRFGRWIRSDSGPAE